MWRRSRRAGPCTARSSPSSPPSGSAQAVGWTRHARRKPWWRSGARRCSRPRPVTPLHPTRTRAVHGSGAAPRSCSSGRSSPSLPLPHAGRAARATERRPLCVPRQLSARRRHLLAGRPLSGRLRPRRWRSCSAASIFSGFCWTISRGPQPSGNVSWTTLRTVTAKVAKVDSRRTCTTARSRSPPRTSPPVSTGKTEGKMAPVEGSRSAACCSCSSARWKCSSA
mmetsp:Transcript_33974/g.79433  ORF Transcript_33974/g.79433 Transcript_33974/m.79433 type:complete len:224 (+) Transcript_33974:654-1325(+)